MTAVGTASWKFRRTLSVLLAEDNVVNQRVVVRMLEKRGHRHLVANCGRQALEFADKEPFDVILMDVQIGAPRVRRTAVCASSALRPIARST